MGLHSKSDNCKPEELCETQDIVFENEQKAAIARMYFPELQNHHCSHLVKHGWKNDEIKLQFMGLFVLHINFFCLYDLKTYFTAPFIF